ncbi:MAG: hypothetical protein AAF645_02345, partial [Myxococcota bacterium]
MDSQAAELIASLRRNPDDVAAYRALCSRYQQLQDFASLVNLVEGWGGRQRDPLEAANAYLEAGDLVYHHLQDPQRAHQLYAAAVQKDPRKLDAIDRLIHTAELLADASQILEALRHRLALAIDRDRPEDIADAEHRIGELYEHSFGRPDKAVAHYRKAFETLPTALPSIYAAREIYRTAGNFRAAAPLIELEARAEPDLGRRTQLLRELAHVCLNELSDAARAVDALSQAAELAPDDGAVLHELQEALGARVREGNATDAERTRAADLALALARRAPEHALAYAGNALDLAPAHEPAMVAFEDAARQQGQDGLLPARWVAYLQHDGPNAESRRRSLGFAYLAAGQLDDAVACFEPLARGDDEVDAQLVDLYTRMGRPRDALEVSRAVARSARSAERMRAVLQGYRDLEDALAAKDVAEELLAMDPANGEALGYLEAHHRQAGDMAALRTLLSNAARVPGVDLARRVAYLEQVAELCETTLSDPNGALEAYQAIAASDPSNDRAVVAITRLLRSTERYDELAAHLSSVALTLTDPERKVAALRELATLHRRYRHDAPSAIAALRDLLQLAPGDEAARQQLCDALLDTEDGLQEGTRLLAEQSAAAPPGEGRADRFERLADLYERRLGDLEQAFTASTRVLEDRPTDLGALDRMARIDRHTGRSDRLAETLAYRADVLEGEASAAAYSELGDLLRSQQDLDGAARAFTSALDHAPDDGTLLDRLCAVYEESGRDAELVRLLEGRAAKLAGEDAREVHRRIARIHMRGRDAAQAEASWHAVLGFGEDREALDALIAGARLREEGASLVELLARAADLAQGTRVRDLKLEQAEALIGLERTVEAQTLLRSILDSEPAFAPALDRLLSLASDPVDRAEGLERKLARDGDAATAAALADLYEGPLNDGPRAIAALTAWATADDLATEPLDRARPLLRAAERYPELLGVLDRRAELSVEDDERRALVREAARVASEHIGDTEGAWLRLQAHIEDAACDAQLERLAQNTNQLERLANVYAQIAKSTSNATRWQDAANAFEAIGAMDKALESVLRAFASDMTSEPLLDEVDRLAKAANAMPRLAQVYDKLVASQGDRATFLLRRHAAILIEQNDEGAALTRVLHAARLEPEDDAHLAEAIRLARRTGRVAELLPIYEARKAAAANDDERVEALLGAIELLLTDLQDEPRATSLLAQAVALTLRTPELRERLEGAMKERQRTLSDLYARMGHDADDDPRAGAELLRRAGLLDAPLDAKRALMHFKAATEKAALPAVLEDFEAFAKATNPRFVLEHYAALIDDAIDPLAVAELSGRRAYLLAELGQHAEAAESFRRAVDLRRTRELVDGYFTS